jgi:transposase-like protein
MAKLSDTKKKELLADFLTGKYSQRELSRKYTVSLGTVSNLTKEVERKNEHLVDAQTVLLNAKSILPIEQMNAIMNTANDIVRRQGLVFGGLEKLAKRMSEQVDANKKMEKLNVAPGIQNFEPVELNPQDYKALADGFASVGKSLGIIEDKPQVAIQNNNQVNNNLEDEIIITVRK